jgi:hypothetical protein
MTEKREPQVSRDKINIIWYGFDKPHASRDRYLIIWQSIRRILKSLFATIVIVTGVTGFLMVFILYLLLHLLLLPLILIHDKILELRR